MSDTKTLPRLTEVQVRQLATKQSFERGDRYYRDGAIVSPIRQGSELRADCEGSHLYFCQATLGSKNGVTAATCTCEYDWGGICKHLVALLLTYVRQPNAFDVVPPVEELLASRSQAELVALVGQMVQRHPDLLTLIEISAPRPKGKPLDLSTYRRQVQKAFRRQEMEEMAEDLSNLQQAADQLLQQGDWLNAGMLYQLLLTESTKLYDDEVHSIDYDGEVCVVIQDVAEGLGNCLAAAQDLDRSLRRDWLMTCFEAYLKDLELGGIDFAAGALDAVLEGATKEEWVWLEQRIREEIDLLGPRDRWARDALVKLLAVRHDQSGDSESARSVIHELGSPEQRAFILIEEGKFAEAIALAEENFVHLPGLMVQFADALVEAGEHQQAFQFISQQKTQKGRWGYQDWLANYHQKFSDPQTALAAYQKLFEISPSLDDYKQLKKLAQGARVDWETVRSSILQTFEQQKAWPMLLEIALYEQELDRALELVGRYPVGAYQARVAQAAEKTKPQAAIALYQRLVEQAIAQKGRPSYKTAAQYLKRLEPLFAAIKTQDDWKTYLKQIRSEYSQLPALQDELNKAGLPK